MCDYLLEWIMILFSFYNILTNPISFKTTVKKTIMFVLCKFHVFTMGNHKVNDLYNVYCFNSNRRFVLSRFTSIIIGVFIHSETIVK